MLFRSLQAGAAAAQVIQIVKKPGLEELVRRRVQALTDYQDAAYAAQYSAFVEQVRQQEATLGGGLALTENVARYLYKLMAYKDEYEVARLHTHPDFLAKLDTMFEGDWRIVHHLAPPLLSKTNERGELVKRRFGPWVRSAFVVLRGLKGLREIGRAYV